MLLRMRSLMINLSLAFLAICLSLLVLELLLRAVPLPKGGDDIEVHNNLFMQYDPLLGWRKKPNQSGWNVSSEYQVLEEINSKGIRGPEYPYEKKDGVFRVLIVGDSFAEGRMIAFKELLSEVLNTRLHDSNGRSYEVINAGTSGYSTDQELLYNQSEGTKYRPDLTVLMFYYNDIWYNVQPQYWRGRKPLFEVQADTLQLTNVPVPRPAQIVGGVEQVPRKKKKWTFLLGQTKRFLAHHSVLYAVVRNRVMRSYDLYTLAMALHLAQPPDEKYTVGLVPDEMLAYETPYRPEIRLAWNVTEAILREFKAETASEGSDLVVFYVPSRAEIYPDDWEATKRMYGMKDKDGWSIGRVAAELSAVCQANNIACIDPSEKFRTEAKRLETTEGKLYFIEDDHWTPLGHKLAGEILANYVLSRHSGSYNTAASR